MQKKQILFKTKGMNRDLSASAFKPEFSFENINIRLATSESNTKMSWVNERGTKEVSFNIDGYWENENSLSLQSEIKGKAIGTAVLNNKLVVFTVGETSSAEEKARLDALIVEQETLKSSYEREKTNKGAEKVTIQNRIEGLKNSKINEESELADIITEINKYGTNPQDTDTFIEYKSTSLSNSFDTLRPWPWLNDQTITYQDGEKTITRPAVDLLDDWDSLTDGSTPDEKYRGLYLFKTVLNSISGDVHQYYTGTNYETAWETAYSEINRLMQAFDDNTGYQNLLETKGIKESNIAVLEESINAANAELAVVNQELSNLDIEIGNCVALINTYTAQKEGLPEVIHLDRIYLVKRIGDTSKYKCILLYEGDLNFKDTNPLETLVSFESVKVQKVYWLDGINPLRVINIANTSIDSTAGYSDTSFDNRPTLQLKEQISVTKNYTLGMFASGVIQYCFTYHNKYAPESNIFYTTPLLYISNPDRGGSPEERIQNSFKIVIENCDTTFDYVTIYSIHRTSLNATPICKRIISIETATTVTYIDTGFSGEAIDPTELLYKNSQEAIFQTMAQKDNTLFLGGITLLQKENIQAVLPEGWKTKNLIRVNESQRTITLPKTNAISNNYPYVNQLSLTYPCSGFRNGNYYRVGVQFQDMKGYWSEPVFIQDIKITNKALFEDKYEDSVSSNPSIIKLNTLTGTIDSSLGETLYKAGYRKVRALVVLPNINERVTVCQGASVPLVYTQNMLNDGTLGYPSWIVRDHEIRYMQDLPNISSWSNQDKAYYGETCEIEGRFDDKNKFKINWGVRTLHTPDLIHDEDLSYNIASSSITPYKIGTYYGKHCLSHVEAEASSGPMNSNARGFMNQNRTELRPMSGMQNIWGMQPIRSGYWYEDYVVDDADDSIKYHGYDIVGLKWFLTYLWQGSKCLNNDNPTRTNPTALLKEKHISNLIFASRIEDEGLTECYSEEWDGQNPQTEHIRKITDLQVFNQDSLQIIVYDGKTYQGNIDTAIMPDWDEYSYFLWDISPTYDPSTRLFNYGSLSSTKDKGFYKYPDGTALYDKHPIGDFDSILEQSKSNVRLTYRSTPHILFAGGGRYEMNDKLWTQLPGRGFDIRMLVELRRTVNTNTLFGGTSEEALQANTWIPCGEAVILSANGDTTFNYTYGDSYYQRYDIIKSYPYTREDMNQLTEIMSIPLETYVNVDGRYDRNRGLMDNTNVTPENFNLVNPVYSQIDNFFSYRIIGKKDSNNNFPNQITWTKTKQPDEETDTWTQITLANTLELDGDKGKLTKLTRLGDLLLAFQDNGISQILYNENVQISSTEGVPIEIANSDKVRGKRYLSDTVGCSNKWSICLTPSGLYFIDSNEKSIYLFNGKLSNLSTTAGMYTWCKQNIPDPEVQWTPVEFNNFITYYDRVNQDVLFVNKDIALAWSEHLGTFTSFYNYGGAPYFVLLKDRAMWLTNSLVNSSYKVNLWEHNTGNYCKFFGAKHPYSITILGNPETPFDKIFTNLEFRAEVSEDGIESHNGQFTPFTPFDYLETWNSYQHGKIGLTNSTYQLSNNVNSQELLDRSFRIWRCEIPRDNVNNSSAAVKQWEVQHGIFRVKGHPMDRMRNPWLYLKLEKTPSITEEMNKTEIHDIVMTYYI